MYLYAHIMRVPVYIAVDPVPCDEILRAAFIGMSWLKYAVTFSRAAGFRGVVIFQGNTVG